ncbi:hypothetical protein D9M68_519770 [compost metagenome]
MASARAGSATLALTYMPGVSAPSALSTVACSRTVRVSLPIMGSMALSFAGNTRPG